MPSLKFRYVASYSEVTPSIDQHFNYPKFTASFSKQDFEKEFDQAHDTLMAHLSNIGKVVEGWGEGDFSLYRYVDLNRGITAVLESESAYKLDTIQAVLSALQALPTEYVIRLDAHPAYVCVFKDGRVLGYEPASHNGILSKLGFPQSKTCP
jgi:hypothetical protein